MSKLTKAITALGIVAGLGVAAMPLSTYAAKTASENSQMVVQMMGALSISVTNTGDATDYDASTMTLDLGELIVNGTPSEKSIDVVVSSNGTRTVKLTIKNSDANNLGLKGDNGKDIPANANFGKGIAGWGYKVESGSYRAITASDVDIVASGTTSQEGVSTPVVSGKASELRRTITFGASADVMIPDGTYTGSVIFTATALDV